MRKRRNSHDLEKIELTQTGRLLVNAGWFQVFGIASLRAITERLIPFRTFTWWSRCACVSLPHSYSPAASTGWRSILVSAVVLCCISLVSTLLFSGTTTLLSPSVNSTPRQDSDVFLLIAWVWEKLSRYGSSLVVWCDQPFIQVLLHHFIGLNYHSWIERITSAEGLEAGSHT